MSRVRISEPPPTVEEALRDQATRVGGFFWLERSAINRSRDIWEQIFVLHNRVARAQSSDRFPASGQLGRILGLDVESVVLVEVIEFVVEVDGLLECATDIESDCAGGLVLALGLVIVADHFFVEPV